MTARPSWDEVMAELPLIAILRGVTPHEAVQIAAGLATAGFRCLEIPLNSPEALKSIENIRSQFDGKLTVGAGTVLDAKSVSACRTAGAQFIVSPNVDAAVVAATKTQALISIPGVLTPTEALVAIQAGADALKLFPAEHATPASLRALNAVIPRSLPILPVGGISPASIATWVKAGAAGFGIGSALYTAGADVLAVRASAAAFVKAWQACRT